MKKYLLLTLCALLSLSQGVLAQPQMHVNMKNGSVMNVFVSEIESITWDDPTDDPGENNPDDPTVTGDAVDVTENSATIVGYANNVRDNESTDLKIGIIYCTEGTPNKSNGTQRTVSKSQVDADGRYTINLTGLGRGTTYYYRSFVYQSGLWFYGKVRSFTTTAQNITANFQTYAATNVTCFSAKVGANLQLVSSLSYGSMTYGICYGKDSEPTERLKASGKDGAGNYSVTLRALEGNTIYYYRPYAEVDGTTYYGQSSSFKTLEDNVVVTGDADADLNVRSRLTIGGGSYSQLEVGLCWSSTNELPTVSDVAASTNELDDENYYVVEITDYGNIHYRAYVKIDGVAHYGAVKSVENKFVGEPVDLGLSVKWANCNVGAESPEEYGDYFAWGETEPYYQPGYAQENPQAHWKSGKSGGYAWSSYKYCKGSYDTMTKYCTNSLYGTVDNKTVLDLSDDPAHVNWGGDWRMPTKAEQDELRTECTWTWTTQNGVNGYKVVSKVNGNSIFLPASGYRYDSSLNYVGSYGGYWSSSLSEDYSSYACGLYFDSSSVYGSSSCRYDGRSVRAVCPVSVTGISLDKQSVEIMEGGTETLNATVSYENGVTGNTATWSSSNTGVATVDDTGKITAVSVGTCTVTATVEGFSATCTVTVKPFEPEYVDLGLSVKWATFNVGAEKPEDYGDYFAWGETSPKSNYSWSTYKYCKGSNDTMTKYCTSSSYGTVDNITVLDLSDDAAHVNWGGSWRMPTKAEFDELLNSSNCTWTWTTMNGVNGYKVVSKKSGYADNWIFLPAAGFRDDTYLNFVGSYGSYWSSSLYESDSYDARGLYFGSGYSCTSYDGRYYGQSLRPVFPVSVTGISLDKQSVELMEGGTETLTATVRYENGVTGNTATWSSSNTGVATVDDTGKITAVSAGTCTVTATVEGFSATCTVTVKPFEPEYVDLGLSVKWATFNVGASRPEDYGDYFAWGETSPKSNYNWSTYKYCKGSYYTMTKYCTSSSYGTVDNITVLDLSDDPAHVNWGGDWRMPTKAEQDELRTECTWTWTTQNGVNGYKVVSKVNGNSIFLPASGSRRDSSLYDVGSVGYYWSSSLNESNSYGECYLLYFSSGDVSRDDSWRDYGQSVRAVCP